MDPEERGPVRRVIDAVAVLGLLWALAATALVLSARFFWLGDIATSFRWQLGWSITPFLPAFLAGRRWRILALTALLAGFLLWPDVSLYLPRDAEAVDGPRIEVASMNLLWSNRRFGPLMEWLEKEDPDIVALQEVSTASRALFENRSHAYPHRIVVPDEFEPSTWGLAILSKHPFESQRAVRPVQGDGFPVVEVQVRIEGTLVTVRNYHAPVPRGRAPGIARRNEALRKLAERFEWKRTPTVFLGDLNTPSTAPAFRDLLDATGLRDTRRGFGRHVSWCTEAPIPGLWVCIDHILSSSDIAVISRSSGEIVGSDHRYALARLRLPGATR